MQQLLKWYNWGIAAVLSVLLLTSLRLGDQANRNKTGKSAGSPIAQIVRSVDLDRTFDLAGEPLPMDNFDVRERLEREMLVNTYWQSSTVLMLKRSRRYFPIIEPILKEEGIPDDFKYLAAAESALSDASSPAGAKGIWQFMKRTAEGYDLKVSSEVDERYHLEKATRAACQYIKDYYKRFGSWTLAAAAYNIGGTNMSRYLREQKAETFYDLNVNSETMRYLFRVVALKEILSRPEDFGFYIDANDYYPPFERTRTIEVTKSIANLGDFAREYDCSYRLLKIYNPWLRDSQLSVRSGETYLIEVPR